MTDLDAALGDATIRERLKLRRGGTVALTDDDLLVAADDEITRVALDDVAEVTYEEFDWFLGVLSVALTVWGLYSTQQSVPIGLAFAGFGAASLYWTYRKRGKAKIRVVDRSKPLVVYPADASAFVDAMDVAIAEE